MPPYEWERLLKRRGPWAALFLRQQLPGQLARLFCHRQHIELIQAKPASIPNIRASLKGACNGPGHVVDDDIVVLDPAVLVANHVVNHSSNLAQLDPKARLFPRFPPGGIVQRFSEFDCATRKGPESPGRFLVPLDQDEPRAIPNDHSYGDNGPRWIFAPHGLHPRSIGPAMIAGEFAFVNARCPRKYGTGLQVTLLRSCFLRGSPRLPLGVD